MEDHDIIVECAKYILDNTRDDTCPALMASHRSRSAMDYNHGNLDFDTQSKKNMKHCV